jgi:xylulokinase
MRAYLTFDLGTTALKTALIAADGRALAIHTTEYALLGPRPDWVEMAPQTYWDAVASGTRAVFAESGAAPSSLEGIGFSSQAQTFIPIDRKGRPLRNAIVWVDTRAQEIADEWEATWLPRDEYRRISGYPWLPAALTVFKIAWLARYEPAALLAWKFLFLPDFIMYRLTGETVTDRITAQGSGLFDFRAGGWEPRLLAASGVSSEQLPTVLDPGTVAGRLQADAAAELGIPAGVPVCIGANDQLVGAIGAGNVRPGIVTATTGTSLALVATTAKLLDDPRMFVGRHAVPDAYCAMPFAITSAIVLKWFRDLCAPDLDYDTFLAGVGAVPPGCDGLAVLPHFAGTGSPTFNPHARGAFVGLTLGHTRAHLARAIMEACACILQECLELIRDHGLQIETVRALGGAARSDLWMQMKADMLGLPVERPACSDAASLGAAMLAAAGLGHFSTVREAAEAWYRPSRVFQPDAGRFPVYREVFERYRTLYDRLYGGA